MLFSGSDWFTANSANSSRVETPSLSKMLLRWCLTVSSLILKYSAISLFEYPATTAATISSSRGVKPNFFCRASSVEDCTRFETLSRPTQYSPDITVWIAFRSSCVAESFRTTPRAPNCSASTIWLFSAAAVSRITRTGGELAPVLKSRSASRPGCLGMARSSRRMSGFNCRARRTASAPSAASPNTFKSDSASRSRRSPSRKIGWSSAITIRTGCGFLKFIQTFPAPRNFDFQARTLTGIRFYSECAPNQTDSFPDDRGTLAQLVQLLLSQAAGKWKALAVILQGQAPLRGSRTQAHQRMFRSAVLAHIHQSFLHNPQHLPANLLRHLQFLNITHE